MAENKLNEDSLKKVSGGITTGGGSPDRPEGFEKAKYGIGYWYKSDLLNSGIPNHYITITVEGYRKDGEIIIYKLKKHEESYYSTLPDQHFEQTEDFIDNHRF